MYVRFRKWMIAGAVVSALFAGCGENPAENMPVAKANPPITAPPASTSEPEPTTPGEGGVAVAEAEPEAVAATTTSPLALAFSNANGSTVNFVGSKKVGGAHNGGFKLFEGTLLTSAESDKPTLEKVTADIDAKSLWSDDDKLTEHLKNKDFFEVETYPTSKFESTSITSGGENGATHTVTGNLTLHGEIKSITFPATVTFGPEQVALKSEFVLNKQEFGMTFTGPGGVIRDEVVIKLDIKAPRAAASSE